MTNKHIVILGGGFAGVWAAVAAARLRHEHGEDYAVDITLVSKEPELTLRPRLYERNPAGIAAPLSGITDAVDVKLAIGEVTGIDAGNSRLQLRDGGEVPFDSLVLATGSQVYRPPIPGISEYAYDVDTRATAAECWSALEAVAASERDPVVAVIGGGLTGVELATEIRAQLDIRTVLIDSGMGIAGAMTPAAADSVRAALDASNVVTCFGRRVMSIDAGGITLSDGTRIDASIVVWTAGMRAHPLSRCMDASTDDLGRLLTDGYLVVPGHPNIFAAGDIGASTPDGLHRAPMSCQYAIPTGILAGHNAAAVVLEVPLIRFERTDYVTCVDLGESGALFTQGWDRNVALTGAEAKQVKQAIMQMIVPPTDREALFSRAAPAAASRDVPLQQRESPATSQAVMPGEG